MVSENTKKQIEALDELVSKSPCLEYADGYYKYGKYALTAESDVEYALSCFSKAKECLQSLIHKDTNGGDWEWLDEWCVETGNSVAVNELYYKILFEEAEYKFESFCYYMERYRKPDKRFYGPRADILRVVVNDLQDLEERKDNRIFYGLSMPPRVGKSTICLFFMAWIMCKRPDSHNAAGGHSSTLMKGFYKELLNLVTTSEYTFKELFFHMHPEYSTQKFPTNVSAEDCSITLGAPDRFPTAVARGYEATWTGAIDVSSDGFLYIDDLIRDREESLSPDRMEKVWQAYANNMLDRTNTGSRQLMVGTLWSVIDPLERMRVARSDDPRYKFRRLSAMNENDESNFQYRRHGFTTEHYREMRLTLDEPEWCAKFMQQPFIREGLLFTDLNYFNGILPEGDYRTIAVVDVAWGGGDSLSMPVAREYENGDVYVFDWVFSTAPKEQTVPQVVGRIIDNQIRQCRFEGNVGGQMYSVYVEQELRKNNYKCACTEKKAPNTMAKMEKIIAYSGDIKRKYYFISGKTLTEAEKEKDKELGVKRYTRSKEYQKAMDELCMFVMIGKNEHDDAADSLTQLEMFIEGGMGAKVEVVKNPFKNTSIFGKGW